MYTASTKIYTYGHTLSLHGARPCCGSAAVLLLPWLSVAAAGESANAPHAPVVLDRHSALGANDCISLGSDRRMTEAITPVLRNRCDYAVSEIGRAHV